MDPVCDLPKQHLQPIKGEGHPCCWLLQGRAASSLGPLSTCLQGDLAGTMQEAASLRNLGIFAIHVLAEASVLSAVTAQAARCFSGPALMLPAKTRCSAAHGTLQLQLQAGVRMFTCLLAFLLAAAPNFIILPMPYALKPRLPPPCTRWLTQGKGWLPSFACQDCDTLFSLLETRKHPLTAASAAP